MTLQGLLVSVRIEGRTVHEVFVGNDLQRRAEAFVEMIGYDYCELRPCTVEPEPLFNTQTRGEDRETA